MSDDRAKRSQTREGRFYDFGTPHASVTTVLGFVDKGGGLANWLKNFIINYFRAMLIDFIAKNPLMLLIDWHCNYFEKWYREALRLMGEGARRGTRLHKWLEVYIRRCIDKNNGVPIKYDCSRMHKEYRTHAELYINWCIENNVVFEHSEFVVHEQTVRVAGTLDKIARVNGRMALCDFKRRDKIRFNIEDGWQLSLLKYLYEAMYIPLVGAASCEIHDLLLICFYKTATGTMKMRVESFDYVPKTALAIAALWWERHDTEKTCHREYIKGETL